MTIKIRCPAYVYTSNPIMYFCHFFFQISYKSDIWSLGCILYNLLYGKTPFQHIVQPWAKVAAITNPSLIVTYPKMRSDCPPVLLKAVQLCLTYEPKKRPTAVELLELPYVNYDII
jgi:serine/threonine-protein kinase TTK/MPS1